VIREAISLRVVELHVFKLDNPRATLGKVSGITFSDLISP
jgi:hypothetical protein